MQNNKELSFEKKSVVLFVLMMASNVCNYLFQIMTGRLLSIEEYAIVNTLLSLLTIFSIPQSIVTLVSARYLAVKNQDESYTSSVIKCLLHLLTFISIFLVIIGTIFQQTICTAFRINNSKYISFILLLAVISVFFSVIYGITQGKQLFFRLGTEGFITAFGKLVLSCFFIYIGWRIYGVLLAIFVGTVVSIIYGMVPLQSDFICAFRYKGKNFIDLKEFYKYAVGTIVLQGCLIAFTNGDMLLVQYYFTDKEAGVYSSAMVIGKIAMYVSSAVVATLFPMVVANTEKGVSTKPLLKKAFLYGGGICVLASTVLLLFGKFIIEIFFGKRYLEAIDYLSTVCIYVVPLTFTTILMNYLLAKNRIRFLAITSIIGIVLCIVLSAIFHNTVMKVMLMCGGVLTVLFVVNMIYELAKKNSKRKEKI